MAHGIAIPSPLSGVVSLRCHRWISRESPAEIDSEAVPISMNDERLATSQLQYGEWNETILDILLHQFEVIEEVVDLGPYHVDWKLWRWEWETDEGLMALTGEAVVSPVPCSGRDIRFAHLNGRIYFVR